MENIKKFEVGKTYKMESGVGGPDEHDIYHNYKVIKRTEKTITIKGFFFNGQTVKSLRVKNFRDSEYVNPWGVYSCNPILVAKDLI